MTNIATNGPLLKKQRIAVTTEGELVVLELGNVTVKLDHSTALQLAAWLRSQGTVAKRRAGDFAPTWNIIGTLQGLEPGEKPGERPW